MKWLRNGTSSIVALLWNIAAIYIFIYLIQKGDKDIKDTVENIIILILSFYFGSTRTMNDKLRSDIDRDNNKKDNTNTNNNFNNS